MKAAILAVGLVVLSAVLAHGDPLSNQAPVKPDQVVVPRPADPEVIRQGGDTIDDATVIDAIPYDNVGTTAGYFDDYDEVCPYNNSTSPDVVYTFTPAGDVALDIDLCGSSYDTKLYVYDEGLNLVGCNDDFYADDECGEFVSRLFALLSGGMQYYIIIDGYGGDFGDYILSITEFVPCVLDCPPEGFPEGEPDLVDDYVDEYNSGCGGPGPPFLAFQNLNFGPSFVEFCGVAGWYLSSGSQFRDTDWFTATVGENGIIEVTADAESVTYIFELGPQDCAEVAVVQWIEVGPCVPASMTITGEPFATVWLWAGSANFSNPGDVPGNEYLYLLTLDGLEGSATESSTWSQVKGLYR